jgi:hypothetical protein
MGNSMPLSFHIPGYSESLRVAGGSRTRSLHIYLSITLGDEMELTHGSDRRTQMGGRGELRVYLWGM